MADSRIVDLPSKGTPAGTDVTNILDAAAGNDDKKVTLADFPISTATQTALDSKLAKTESNQYIPNGGAGYIPTSSIYSQINPIANTPNETYACQADTIEFDTNLDGFSIGVGGQAAQIHNMYYKHIGESDTGALSYINMNSDLGNGVDAIDIAGLGFCFGFANIDANVTISGPIQGYGFQPNMDAASVMNSYINAFYDFSNISAPVNSYQSFAAGPNIAEVTNNANYNGLNLNPTITTFSGNAGFNGFALSPNLGSFDTGYFNGILINPTVSSIVNATGLYIDMTNVNASGNKTAAQFTGDVNINGALTFTGALSVGKLSAFASQAAVNGGGTPSSIHSLITNPTIAANTTTINADTIGVNTAMLLSIGDNSTTTSGGFGLGMAALAFPAVVTTGTGSSLDYLAGAVFAVNFDGASTGGTINQAYGARSVFVPNGITTVNRIYGFFAHQPFGLAGTDNWGVYSADFEKNYFQGSVVIGSSDTPTNSSCGLEIASTTKAFVVSRMSSTDITALTATNGMIVYDTTTNKFRGYENGAWANLI